MRILFQGDSITDCGRNRQQLSSLGSGSAMMVKGQLGLEYPAEHEYINKGVSGNRSVDLYARIKADILNLKPDFMSILLGVNDVWHEYDGNNGVDADKYYKIYSMLIGQDMKTIIYFRNLISGASLNGPRISETVTTLTFLREKYAKIHT